MFIQQASNPFQQNLKQLMELFLLLEYELKQKTCSEEMRYGSKNNYSNCSLYSFIKTEKIEFNKEVNSQQIAICGLKRPHTFLEVYVGKHWEIWCEIPIHL